MRTGMVYSRV